MKRMIVTLVLLGLVGPASADPKWFNHWGGTGNNLWSDINNWNNGQAPLPSGLDDVYLFPNGGTGGLIQMDNTASVVGITLNSAGNTELEVVSGGNLTWTTQAWPTFGTVAGRTHTLTMSGGTLDVQAGPWFAFGNAGTGILNMDAGLLTTSNLRIDWDTPGGSGHAYVTGGTIELTGVMRIGLNGLLDITGGQIISRGVDDTTTLQGYITSGHITGASLSDVYFDGTDTYVIPEPATLGLFALIGGGMVWIRKRLMI
ncbi:MAG: hypothetical protein DRP64_02535 [Verrucomicrobia bacterium]|nr:MAG: hypothetical protein DRP64_02535 [Verrucomicrobiota bacterium]